MKRLSILGSTGSIGTNTLRVAREWPDRFRVVALAARESVDLLLEQIRQFKPELVSVASEKGITQYRSCPAVNAGTWAR